MNGQARGSDAVPGPPGPVGRLAAALAVTLTAATLVAGCGPAAETGDEASEAPDTMAPGPAADTAAGEAPRGADTAAIDTLPAGAVDTSAAAGEGGTEDAEAGADTASADSVAPAPGPGAYMVYVRRGASPDSVAADHGVDSLRLVPELPGFYARLTAEQARSLAGDDRVREMARQIEGEPMPEPRTMPMGEDTASGV